MPYFIHNTTDQTLESALALYTENYWSGIHSGIWAHTAKDAHETLQRKRTDSPDASWSVTFHATQSEIEDFHYREREKVRARGDAGCARVPWYLLDWQIALDALHHAYLSVDAPGMVAYTPSLEWGVTDRQLRVRPGRYLQQFANHLSQVERDELCAQVKAHDDSYVMHFTTSPREIEMVYTHGPSSCMSHGADEFVSGSHPVRVYGDSPDLALAYVGTLNDASARAIVWPERKVFGRIYGNRVLSHLLKAQGYTGPEDYLLGARIRKVASQGSYIMPYLDIADYVRDDGAWFVTTEHRSYDDDDVFDAKQTNGLLDGSITNEDTYMCRHCDEREVEEDGNLCGRCERHLSVCARCDHESFDDSHSIINDDTWCERCTDNYATRCESCEELYDNSDSLTRRERYQRECCDVDDDNVCESCAHDAIADAVNRAHALAIEYLDTVQRERLAALAARISYAMNLNTIGGTR